MIATWKHPRSLDIDPCENLVFLLEFLSNRSSYQQDGDAELINLIEKASLYRSFLDLSGLTLIEQIIYVFQKFTEYNDRLEQLLFPLFCLNYFNQNSLHQAASDRC